jgi:site-specific DNA-methyltransferase (adenine-specific)
MATMPAESVDLVVTDPPYLANYHDRSGRSIAGDRTGEWLRPAFNEVYRLMKPDSFLVCFYGWHVVEQFMTAWQRAGFRTKGHIVWRKTYRSSTGHLGRYHEQAYLLSKGRPLPQLILPDVLEWRYSGNRHHPTQKPIGAMMDLVRAYSRPGDVVLDPFCGAGSTLVAAKRLGRHYIGIDISAEYCRAAEQRLKIKR